jgi:hypothetical protein
MPALRRSYPIFAVLAPASQKLRIFCRDPLSHELFVFVSHRLMGIDRRETVASFWPVHVCCRPARELVMQRLMEGKSRVGAIMQGAAPAEQVEFGAGDLPAGASMSTSIRPNITPGHLLLEIRTSDVRNKMKDDGIVCRSGAPGYAGTVRSAREDLVKEILKVSLNALLQSRRGLCMVDEFYTKSRHGLSVPLSVQTQAFTFAFPYQASIYRTTRILVTSGQR